MDQLYSSPTAPSPGAEPEEVVLTYRPEEDSTVVLSYEVPLPQPPQAPPPEPVTPRRPRRRPRHGLPIFFFSLAVLFLSIASLILAASLDRRQSAQGNWEDKFHQYWDDYQAEGEGETTIPAYPTGGEFRLETTEERGEILTAQEVYQQVNPSVVSVVSYLDNGTAGIGTGVILSEDGYLVTNYHVIEGGSQCDVLLSTGYTFEAQLVGYDEENDLAVLKLETNGLQPAVFGSSDLLTVGDKAYAIGNPLGLELRGTLTDGIISAINRDVDVDGVTMTLIQTNAALNSGNSGGPLINEYGQVVGINTIKMVSNYADDTIEGLGFAIPSSTVAHIVNCLIETGQVTPEPVLGITVQGQVVLDDGTTGMVVIEVTPGLGGEIAGVQVGDIIVSADGEPVITSSDVIRCRRHYQAGEELPMTVFRDGRFIDVMVPLMLPEE